VISSVSTSPMFRLKVSQLTLYSAVQEALVMDRVSNINHKNIIGYHGCLVRDGRVTGIVLDRYERDLMGYFSLSDTKDVPLDAEKRMVELESAVSHLHSAGLAHNDLKPSNVMLGVTIEDYVAIATMSIILPGVTVKSGALVGAHSSVSKTVAPDTVVAGTPAKYICDTKAIKLKDGSNQSAYPWRRHFHRGYPEAAVAAWVAEFASN